MCPNKEEKQSLPDNYYKKVEKDWHEAAKMMKEGFKKAECQGCNPKYSCRLNPKCTSPTSRIDVIGQNGNDGDHYDDK